MKFTVPLIGQDKTVTVNLTVDLDTVIVHGNRSDGLPMCALQPPLIMAGIDRPDRITVRGLSRSDRYRKGRSKAAQGMRRQTRKQIAQDVARRLRTRDRANKPERAGKTPLTSTQIVFDLLRRICRRTPGPFGKSEIAAHIVSVDLPNDFEGADLLMTIEDFGWWFLEAPACLLANVLNQHQGGTLVQLELPTGLDMASRALDDATGVQVRVIREFEIQNNRHIWRADIGIGA